MTKHNETMGNTYRSMIRFPRRNCIGIGSNRGSIQVISAEVIKCVTKATASRTAVIPATKEAHS